MSLLVNYKFTPVSHAMPPDSFMPLGHSLVSHVSFFSLSPLSSPGCLSASLTQHGDPGEQAAGRGPHHIHTQPPPQLAHHHTHLLPNLCPRVSLHEICSCNPGHCHGLNEGMDVPKTRPCMAPNSARGLSTGPVSPSSAPLF